ncbi:MAG: methionine biosynthesis protein MetW [Oscillospiraceae bacterium]|nr:methionine biosynthesis protein MetW [Oscillospiraceae bacterium]
MVISLTEPFWELVYRDPAASAFSKGPTSDLAEFHRWISPGSRVLDVGCGEGRTDQRHFQGLCRWHLPSEVRHERCDDGSLRQGRQDRYGHRGRRPEDPRCHGRRQNVYHHERHQDGHRDQI